jgi:Fe2+ or Zn2+ uptake regulation protein
MAPDIKTLILGILKRERKPLTVREIQDKLRKMGFNFTYYWLKLKLDELSSHGFIAKFKEGRLTRYADRDVAVHTFITLDQFIEFTTSDRVERARVREDGYLSEDALRVFEYTVQEWLGATPARLWNNILRPKLLNNKNILRFSDENPKKLVGEALEYLVHLYNEITLRHRNSSELQERRGLEKKREILDREIRRFASYVGIPTVPSGITINFKKERAEIVDWKLILTLLEENIFGDKVIEWLNPSKDFSAKTPVISVGIDETQFEVPANYILGRAVFALGPAAYTAPVYINAAVASWLEIGGGEAMEVICHDPRPTPEEWSEYTHHKAVSEGLILTPGELSRYSENIWKRAAEAAMNAVGYRKARETIKPPQGVLERVPTPRPSMVLLDGRLFPYEHVVDDYMHDHHEQVKIAIQEFNALMALNDAYNDPRNPATLYYGLVKRSPFEFFKVLLAFWMLKERILDDGEFWKILSCNMPDGWLLWKIFSLIREVSEEAGILVSFRVRHPFASMVRGEPLKNLLDSVGGDDVKKKVEALKDQSRWVEFLEKYAIEKKNKPLIDVIPYAVICAKGSVLAFFCDVPYLKEFENILLPRFEVLMPYSAQQTDIDEFVKVAVERVAALLYFKRNWMVFHKLFFQDGKERETSMVVTREVNSAHEYANRLGRHYRAVVIGLLEKALINLLSRSGG